MRKRRCPSLNHHHAHPTVRFCPECGVMVNGGIAPCACSAEKHATEKWNRNRFCSACGAQLLQVRRSWGRPADDAAMEDLTMEDGKPTDSWIRDLYDEKAPTRCTAAYELGKAGDLRAVAHLVKALKDAYFSVRRYAAESLGILGNEEAVGGLIEALDDDDLDFREAVVGALARITNQFFSSPEEWNEWYRHAIARPNLP